MEPNDAAVGELEPVEIAEETSVADHAAAFDPNRHTDEEPDEAAEPIEPIRPIDRQRRADTGQFQPGHKRIKASDAVGRINALTARAKKAEEELAQLRGTGSASAPATSSSQAPPPAPQQTSQREPLPPPRPQMRPPQAQQDPEPREDDAKYANDYGKYLEDRTRWVVREEHRQIQQQQYQQQQQRQVQQRHFQTMQTWDTRLTAAKSKYPDFEQVALLAPTRIPPMSAIDAFVMEDDGGHDVLYYLQHPTHAQELDELLRMPLVKQLRKLALLSERLSSPQPGAAGTTGSAPGNRVVILPKPPNPVRTEAQSRVGEGPPMDRDLSLAEHAKHFAPKRR